MEMKDRPRVLMGQTEEKSTGCGSVFITLNVDGQGNLVEVFLTMGKAGGCASATTQAIGRLLSISLRNGVPPELLMKQLAGISCHSQSGFGTEKIQSCADAVAQVIRAFLDAKKKAEEKGDIPIAA